MSGVEITSLDSIEIPRQYRPRNNKPMHLRCYKRVETQDAATNGGCDNFDPVALGCIYCGAAVRSARLRGAPSGYDPRHAIDKVADWKQDWE